jgi:hypothetical protein
MRRLWNLFNSHGFGDKQVDTNATAWHVTWNVNTYCNKVRTRSRCSGLNEWCMIPHQLVWHWSDRRQSSECTVSTTETPHILQCNASDHSCHPLPVCWNLCYKQTRISDIYNSPSSTPPVNKSVQHYQQNCLCSATIHWFVDLHLLNTLLE